MKYAVKMGSHAVIYIPSFIKFGSGVQKFIWERYTYRHTDTQTDGRDL
jgi:hypothetical protein